MYRIIRPTLILALACVAFSAIIPGAASALTTENSTRCGLERDTGKRVCYVSSSAYPQAKGWYGFTAPSSPCNGGPFEGFWPEGVIGICSFHSYDAWKWSNTGWTKSTVGESVKGYVYPFADGWRWFYTERTGWMAVRSADLGLRWYA